MRVWQNIQASSMSCLAQELCLLTETHNDLGRLFRDSPPWKPPRVLSSCISHSSVGTGTALTLPPQGTQIIIDNFKKGNCISNVEYLGKVFYRLQKSSEVLTVLSHKVDTPTAQDSKEIPKCSWNTLHPLVSAVRGVPRFLPSAILQCLPTISSIYSKF